MKFFLAFLALFVAASAQDYGNTRCQVSKGKIQNGNEINFGQKFTFSKQIIAYLAVRIDMVILYLSVGNVTTGVTILKTNVLFARWELMLWEST